MRLSTSILFRTGTIFASIVSLSASLNDGQYQIKASIDTITKENEAFWIRFLQTDGDLSVVTPSPTPEATCSVDVTLLCTTNDDIPCKDIKSPPSSCTANGKPIDSITFRYQGGTCKEDNNDQGSASFCEDTASNNFTDPVFIFCLSEDGSSPLDVEPRVVQPGGTFTVSNTKGKTLPSEIDCAIVDEDNNPIQQNVIDTSGDVPLNLQDAFGSLTVEGCSDQSCIQTINYVIDIMNSGSVDMNIKNVSFGFNGNITELVKDLKNTSLGPDKSTVLLVEEVINVCTSDEFEASVAVSASHNGKECEDRDEYNFIVVAASTPSPVTVPKNTSSPTLTEPVTTAEPTLSPVIQPTNVPTMAMSDIPSDLPSQISESSVPTNQVASTSKPSLVIIDLTEVPTIVPSAKGSDISSAPTSKCLIGVDLSCSVGSGPNAGQLCDTPGVEVQQCLERPTQSTMLYNGGNCDQSENRQLLKFNCTDFNGGPSISGSVYIIVTDANGNGITYFEGSVNASDNYILDNDGEQFESDMIISIYGSSVATDTNLLQRVEYSSSCNTILEINNRFGASQIVQFFNEIQGNVTSFIDATFELSVQIPTRFDGDNATMQSLVSVTNFAGTVNLTSRINGQTLSPGSNIAIFLNTTLDYSTRKRYTALTTASATSNPLGNLCTGSDFYAFQGGAPAAPSVPTAIPTRSPTVTPAPTPDLATSACEVNAEIICEVLRNNRTIGTCSRVLSDPAAVKCENGNYPTLLSFIYRGVDPSVVFVTVQDSVGFISNFTVSTNEIFSALGVFNETATITVSTLSNGEAGDTLEEVIIDTSCEDANVLRLGERFGSIQLVGFANGGGYYTSVYPVRISYVVMNGPINSILDTAYINSAFRLEGPFNAIPIPVISKPSEKVIVYREQTVIDASEKFGNGITFNFGMNVTATAQQSGIGCSAEDVATV